MKVKVLVIQGNIHSQILSNCYVPLIYRAPSFPSECLVCVYLS